MTTTVDHVALALDRLPQQWRDKPNVIAFVTLFAEQVQDLEDALWALRVDRAIATAEGEQLDAIGVVVGEARVGQEDDAYRLFLRARIATNRSSGLVEHMIKIARLLVDDLSVRVVVRNDGNAAMTVRLLGAVTDETADALIGFLRVAASGGVRVTLISSTSAPTATFRFARSGFATEINAAASVASLGISYDAHPDIPSGGGYALLTGTDSTDAAHTEVISYLALNRNTTPDRYDGVEPAVAYDYDGWPTHGAAEVRPLDMIGSTETTGFDGTVSGPHLVPDGVTFMVGDDIVGDVFGIVVPAGTYSITTLAAMLTVLASAAVPGFSYAARITDNEIDTTYSGPGTEFHQEDTTGLLGIAAASSEPAPATLAADGTVSVGSGTGGVWASARV